MLLDEGGWRTTGGIVVLVMVVGIACGGCAGRPAASYAMRVGPQVLERDHGGGCRVVVRGRQR